MTRHHFGIGTQSLLLFSFGASAAGGVAALTLLVSALLAHTVEVAVGRFTVILRLGWHFYTGRVIYQLKALP